MNEQKLRLREKIGYGFGDAASSMFWKLFSMYLMFFYTDIYGNSGCHGWYHVSYYPYMGCRL